MDRVQGMQIFLRVIETGSFAKAAETLSIAPSSVTTTISKLEKHLQTRLLYRSTRRLSLTPAGEQYLKHSREIVEQIGAFESQLLSTGQRPRGRIRVDLPSSLARTVLLPRIRSFIEVYPEIQIVLGINDRPVDLIHEGIDCVIRTGELRDSGLIARRIATLEWITCCSPSYLADHAEPLTLSDLLKHEAVHYFSVNASKSEILHFAKNGAEVNITMAGCISVNETETYIDCALQGLGIVQLARNVIKPYLESGQLLEILEQYRPPPVPVSLIYTDRHFLSPALQAFIDWVTKLFSKLDMPR